jgi:hypothetical protein
MLSIVMGADHSSALYRELNDGFTLTDHLLASMYENQAGLVAPKERIARPGVTDLRPAKMPDVRDPKTKKLMWDSMTIPEFEALRKARLNEPR